MKLTVVADSLLYKTSSGTYWCESIYGYDFWERYLMTFSEVEIVSRTKTVSDDEVKGMIRVDGDNISIKQLPYTRGMSDYIKKYFEIRKQIKKIIIDSECAIIRLPSIVADMFLKEYKKTGKLFFLEIVADPYDAYSFNKIAKYYFSYRLKKSVLQADGVSYVTEYYLQSKYPPKTKQITTHYSTINLLEEHFSELNSYSIDMNRPIKLIHVANSMSNNIKGHDIAIKVVNYILLNGYQCEITFIGDGPYKAYLKDLIIKYKIEDHVNFVGKLSDSNQIRNYLKQSDLFLFPTKAEGLPRALIEAMAIGLPSISTPVNGVPELLEDRYLFNPLNVEDFGNKVISLINNPEELKEMSNNNIITAYKYKYKNLEKKRINFYEKLHILVKNRNKKG